MSTAARVPETHELTGDDAWRTLAHTGHWRLVRDAFVRLRAADGFSHARSLAYLGGLIIVQGTIAFVGIATAIGERGLGDVITRTFRDVFPGPAGRVLTTSVTQAEGAALSGKVAGLLFGLIGGLIASTTMFGQMERGLNRLYGIEQDRPTVKKYGQALGMALTAGALATAAFILLAFGRQIDTAFDSQTLADVWSVAQWPLALASLTAAMALVFRLAPNRQQPAWSWLAYGASISTLLWAGVTVLLGLFFSISNDFGDTYGPLAGIVALMIWALLSAIAVLFGGAVAAQLEAVRSERPGPKDPSKDLPLASARELAGTRR